MFNDLRYALRTLRKSPGFTLAAVLILALGIGANTAIFSVVDAVLLKPLAYSDPDRLVQVWETFPPSGTGTVSPPNVRDWRDQSHAFDYLVAYSEVSRSLQDRASAERIAAVAAEAHLFDMLGAKPVLGRTFLPDEDQPGKPPVVVVSEGLWKRRFGGDRGLIGQCIDD